MAPILSNGSETPDEELPATLAFDKVLDVSFPFPTPSDALLADIALGEGDRPRKEFVGLFNTIVGAVCRPDFRKEDVTMKSFEEILLAVRKQQSERPVAIAKTAESTTTCFQAENTSDQALRVLDYVLHHLKDVALDAIAEEKKYISFWDCDVSQLKSQCNERNRQELRNTVSNLCLVHPSLTHSGRMALGRHVVVRSGGGGRYGGPSTITTEVWRMLRDPTLGKWSQALSIDSIDAIPLDGPVCRSLCRAVSSNLRYLEMCCNIVDSQWRESFVELLGQQRVLHELNLHVPAVEDIPHGTLEELLEFVSAISNLGLPLRTFRLNCQPNFVGFISEHVQKTLLSHLEAMPSMTNVYLQLPPKSDEVIRRMHWTRADKDHPFELHAAAIMDENDLRFGKYKTYRWILSSIRHFCVWIDNYALQTNFTRQCLISDVSCQTLTIRLLSRWNTRTDYRHVTSDFIFLTHIQPSVEALSITYDIDNLSELNRMDFSPWVYTMVRLITSARCPDLASIHVRFRTRNSLLTRIKASQPDAAQLRMFLGRLAEAEGKVRKMLADKGIAMDFTFASDEIDDEEI